jgi:hypothetical protein
VRVFLLALLGGATGALLVIVPALVFVTHRIAPPAPAIAPIGGQGPPPAGTPPPAPTINPTVLAGYRQRQATQAAAAAQERAAACQQLRELYDWAGKPYQPQATAALTIVELEQALDVADPARNDPASIFLRDRIHQAAPACQGP